MVKIALEGPPHGGRPQWKVSVPRKTPIPFADNATVADFKTTLTAFLAKHGIAGQPDGTGLTTEEKVLIGRWISNELVLEEGMAESPLGSHFVTVDG